MKLSTRQQLLSEADVELERLKKMILILNKTNLSEGLFSKKPYPLDVELRKKLLKVIDTAGDGIQNYRASLIPTDFSKKMTREYGSIIQKFFEDYIGQVLPREIIRLLNNSFKNKHQFPKNFSIPLESVDVKVVGTGMMGVTIAVYLTFKGNIKHMFVLWTSISGNYLD